MILAYLNSLRKLFKKTAIFCGKGNNGGDGFVVARQLASRGASVSVYLTASKSDIKSKEAALNMEIISKMGVQILELRDENAVRRIKKRFNADLIIDAIFGTGFSGEAPLYVSNLISFLNETDIHIFSLDIPSGLDGTTGVAKGAAVKADRTLTFGLPKTGFIKNDGPKHTGEVTVLDIAYPKQLL